MNKAYILKKDIQQPNDHDIKAGTIFEKLNLSADAAYTCGKRSFHPDIVENNEEWFKPIITGLIGVKIIGNVLPYKNSASIQISENGEITAIAIGGVIFKPNVD